MVKSGNLWGGGGGLVRWFVGFSLSLVGNALFLWID